MTPTKNVKMAFVKSRVMTIRVQIRNIRTVITIRLEIMSVNVHLLHVEPATNAKRHIREFHSTRTHPTPACVKYYRQKLAQQTKIVRRKRNAATGTASSATPVQKTAIARLQNGAAKTDIVF